MSRFIDLTGEIFGRLTVLEYVGKIKNENSWVATARINGKKTNLGRYNNFEDAIIARLKAEKKYFGEFSPQKHLFKEYGIE